MDLDPSSMWLPELDMEDQGLMNQYDMRKLDDMVDNLSVYSFSSESYTHIECDTDRSIQTATKFEEHNEMNLLSYHKDSIISTRCQTPMNLASTSHSSSNTFTISFGEINPKDDIPIFDDLRGIETSSSGKAQTMVRTPVQVQDHVLAERKRREKLNRQLISLSALLPNLKKLDKASVLEDATNYIRELQDRVKELEELSGNKRKDAKDCIIALKRSRTRGDDDNDSSSNVTSKSLAEIEVRMLGSSVLVRIQSQKSSSLLEKVLNMMQKLGLSIISSSTMPFANTTTLISVVAQIEGEFSVTETNLIKSLQLAL